MPTPRPPEANRSRRFVRRFSSQASASSQAAPGAIQWRPRTVSRCAVTFGTGPLLHLPETLST
jgi:hypothetical protein